MKRQGNTTTSRSETQPFVARGFEPAIDIDQAIQLGIIIGRYLKTISPNATTKITHALSECADSLNERGFTRTHALLVASMLASLTDATNTHDGEGRNLATALQRLSNH